LLVKDFRRKKNSPKHQTALPQTQACIEWGDQQSECAPTQWNHPVCQNSGCWYRSQYVNKSAEETVCSSSRVFHVAYWKYTL